MGSQEMLIFDNKGVVGSVKFCENFLFVVNIIVNDYRISIGGV